MTWIKIIIAGFVIALVWSISAPPTGGNFPLKINKNYLWKSSTGLEKGGQGKRSLLDENRISQLEKEGGRKKIESVKIPSVTAGTLPVDGLFSMDDAEFIRAINLIPISHSSGNKGAGKSANCPK